MQVKPKVINSKIPLELRRESRPQLAGRGLQLRQLGGGQGQAGGVAELDVAGLRGQGGGAEEEALTPAPYCLQLLFYSSATIKYFHPSLSSLIIELGRTKF
jgi:hypothetical protein